MRLLPNLKTRRGRDGRMFQQQGNTPGANPSCSVENLVQQSVCSEARKFFYDKHGNAPVSKGIPSISENTHISCLTRFITSKFTVECIIDLIPFLDSTIDRRQEFSHYQAYSLRNSIPNAFTLCLETSLPHLVQWLAFVRTEAQSSALSKILAMLARTES